MRDSSRGGSPRRGGSGDGNGRYGLLADGVSREEFLKLSGAAGLFVAGSGGVVAAFGSRAGAQSTGGGNFSAPFAEPTIAGQRTSEKCIKIDGRWVCKPAAGSIALLFDDRLLYFNALEGTENIETTILTEIDDAFVNDQTRVLTLGRNDRPSWERPEPNDGGANPDGNESTFLLDGILVNSDDDKNDGALFCADLNQLPDGSIIAVGGTDYYEEAGLVELEGLKNSRVFDPRTDTWRQSGSMKYGRWYPTIVTLPNNDIFVASGVTKLIKPVYPEDPAQSGRNVVQTETFDIETGEWTENSEAAQRSLPLFPRNHLLPNGHVLYNGAGQSFNPFGQAYDQALWNIIGTYDPEADAWSDIGFAGLPLELNETALEQISSSLGGDDDEGGGGLLGGATDGLTGALNDLVGQRADSQEDLASKLEGALGGSVDPAKAASAAGIGFRGSTFSMMLPLEPDDSGNYNEAEFLTAGGVLGGIALTSPGTYVGTPFSRIDTLSTGGQEIGYVSRLTGPLNNPRWYPSGVLLPTGEVMAFSGADRDEVVTPGFDRPVKQAELFDPETETWKRMETANNPRTYHNTAILMPDGRVLVGGHAPISTAYLSNINLEEAGFAPNDGRDPSFEIYSPPYVSEDRPTIENSTEKPRPVSLGQSLPIRTPDAADIESVVLVRRTATTHLVDGDQRTVKLPFEANGSRITARMPESPAVAPAGQYLVFINRRGSNGLVPSVAMPVQIPLAR